MTAAASLAWPASRAGEVLAALARAAGLPVRDVDVPIGTPELESDPDRLACWIEHASARLGIEADAVGAFYPDLEALVRGAPPALVKVGGDRLLALVAVDRAAAHVLAADGAIHRVPVKALWEQLQSDIPDANDGDVESILSRAKVPQRRRERARESLRRTRLAGRWIEGWWIVRLPSSASFWQHARYARVGRRLAAIVLAHVAICLLGLGGWWLVGRGALGGRLDRGWLLAWALLLATQVATQILVGRAQSLLAVDGGAILKQRLLAGALALPPEHVRRHGAGQLLGTVLESEAIESLALAAGFGSILAIVELIAAAAVLACGSSAVWELVTLALWMLLAGVVAHRYWRARRGWTDERIAMTHDLVEKMVGHRTRLAQEGREAWHSREDDAVARSLAGAERMDRAAALSAAVVPRGWLIAGLLALAPAFVTSRTSTASVAGVAVALGGVLLAYRGLRRLVLGLTSLAGAQIAWTRVRPLLEAKVNEPAPDPKLVMPATPEATGSGTVLDAREVTFTYPRRHEPTLRGCTLGVQRGERILLEGRSGGGKSTLAALLAGLREPTGGLLLAGGLDRGTLGLAGWRQRVAVATQFHENHILTGTFAFNLLMGRRWPPRREDLELAHAICQELGLGPLLARMPSGIEQMVGETGWQLSQGERSRLFLARALLQEAEVLVLDESFAALDPHTTRAVFACVLERAKTLLIVAHP